MFPGNFPIPLLRCIPLFLGLVLMAAGPARATCEKPIRIAAPASFAPYMSRESDGSIVGLETRIVAWVTQQMGCDYVYVAMPWKRGLLQLESGRIDIVLMASWKEERTRFATYSLPYRWEAQQMAVHRDLEGREKIRSLEDLYRSGLIVGSLRGAFHGSAYQALFIDGAGRDQHRGLTEPDQVIEQLMLRRIDALLMDGNMMEYLARRAGYQTDIAFLDFTVYRNKVHFLLSKSLPKAFGIELNQAIHSLIESEFYRGLYHDVYRLTPKDLMPPPAPS